MWFLHNPSVSERYDKASGGGVVEPARAWFKINKLLSEFLFFGTFLNGEHFVYTYSVFSATFSVLEIKQFFSGFQLKLWNWTLIFFIYIYIYF